MPFQMQSAKRGAILHVRLDGRLDEHAVPHLERLAAEATGTHVHFDLERIEFVSSIGFRGWINLLRAIETTSTFEFAKCSSAFVDYCDLLPTMSYANRITSFYVQYRCTGCKRVSARLIDVATARKS